MVDLGCYCGRSWCVIDISSILVERVAVVDLACCCGDFLMFK